MAYHHHTPAQRKKMKKIMAEEMPKPKKGKKRKKGKRAK